MIIKVRYSLNDDHEKLYLYKCSSSRIPNFKCRVLRISGGHACQSATNTINTKKAKGKTGHAAQLVGLVSLRECVSLAVLSSPELFQLGRLVRYGAVQATADYSVYNRDIMEPGSPLVGHGSVRDLFSGGHSSDDTNGGAGGDGMGPVVAGVCTKGFNFMLDGSSDTEDAETTEKRNESKDNEGSGSDGTTVREEDVRRFLEDDSYSLEIKLEFVEYFKGCVFSDVPELSNSNNTKVGTPLKMAKGKKNKGAAGAEQRRKTNLKKAPRASRTLSLPIMPMEMDTFMGSPQTQGPPQTRLLQVRSNISVSNDADYQSIHDQGQNQSQANVSQQQQQSKKKKAKAKAKGNGKSRSVIAEHLFENELYNDIPDSPHCINCHANKSSRWAWFRGDLQEHAVGGGLAHSEGLVCKECDDYYKKHDRIRPVGQGAKEKSPPASLASANSSLSKSKKRKSQNLTPLKEESSHETSLPKSAASNKKQKKQKPTAIGNIAETLAMNRTVLDKERKKNAQQNWQQHNRASSPPVNKYQGYQSTSYSHNATFTDGPGSSPLRHGEWHMDLTDLLKTPEEGQNHSKLKHFTTTNNSLTNSNGHGHDEPPKITTALSLSPQSPNSKWLSHMLKSIGSNPNSPSFAHPAHSFNTSAFGPSCPGNAVDGASHSIDGVAAAHSKLAGTGAPKKLSSITQALKKLEKNDTLRNNPQPHSSGNTILSGTPKASSFPQLEQVADADPMVMFRLDIDHLIGTGTEIGVHIGSGIGNGTSAAVGDPESDESHMELLNSRPDDKETSSSMPSSPLDMSPLKGAPVVSQRGATEATEVAS